MAKIFRVHRQGSPDNSLYYSGYDNVGVINRAYSDLGASTMLIVQEVGYVPLDAIVHDVGLSFEEAHQLSQRNAPLLDAMEAIDSSISQAVDSIGFGSRPPVVGHSDGVFGY